MEGENEKHTYKRIDRDFATKEQRMKSERGRPVRFRE